MEDTTQQQTDSPKVTPTFEQKLAANVRTTKLFTTLCLISIPISILASVYLFSGLVLRNFFKSQAAMMVSSLAIAPLCLSALSLSTCFSIFGIIASLISWKKYNFKDSKALIISLTTFVLSVASEVFFMTIISSL